MGWANPFCDKPDGSHDVLALITSSPNIILAYYDSATDRWYGAGEGLPIEETHGGSVVRWQALPPKPESW